MIGNFPRAPHKFPTYNPRQSLLVRVCLGLPKKKPEQNQTKTKKHNEYLRTSKIKQKSYFIIYIYIYHLLILNNR